MERIQEALEKARSERDKLQQGAAQQTPIIDAQEKTRRDFSLGKNLGWFRQGPAQAISVEYSHTRTVKLSEQELKKRRIVAGIAHDPRSEPYRQLRSQVLKKMRSEGWRSLAITSPNDANGKTLTAVNLAISLSQEVNQTVMLVDLDLRNPGVAKSLGLYNIPHGIVDCIIDDTPLEDVLINPGYDRMVIAPGTPQGQHTSEILSSPAMRQLQSELYNRYEDRLIIYDLPALLSSDDALVFTPNVDATILVIEDGATDKSDLERSVSLLQDANLIGSVINKLK